MKLEEAEREKALLEGEIAEIDDDNDEEIDGQEEFLQQFPYLSILENTLLLDNPNFFCTI